MNDLGLSRWILATWFAGLLLAAAAQTNLQPRSLSLLDSIQIALAHNLDVKIARCEPEIAARQVHIASAAYEPALSFSGSHRFSTSPGGLDEYQRPYVGTTTERDSYQAGLAGSLPLGTSINLGSSLSGESGTTPSGPFENGSGSASVSVRQPLLKNFWIDRARLDIRISKNQLKMSELEFRAQIMRIVTSVELAYYDLILAQENIRVREQALDLAKQQVIDNQKRVNVGRMAPQDRKQAESQVANSQVNLLAAQGSLVAAEYRLKKLLSDDFTAWENVRIEPTESLAAPAQAWSVQESLERGLTQRPDFLKAKIDLESQGITLKYLRNQLYPQLDLVGSYGRLGEGLGYRDALAGVRSGDTWFYSVGATLTIPLGNRTPRENYRIGKVRRDQDLLGLKKLEQDIIVEIGNAVEQAQITFARVETARQARQLAEEALAAEQKKLESGQSTTFFVLSLQQNLTGARSAELGALVEYNRALANLALSEATTLQRHNLNLEVR
ncbi:MAG: TolC family protein [Verrucomicrobia bacterium]|nr:TolC family protein [Verrucomicrobiota bacterium]